MSKFVERHNRIARKTGLKGGLEATRAYFALATMYGDVGGSYEPERLDWYRAQYTSELPDPLPAKCMFVHVTETAVTMVLRDGNNRGQDVDQKLSKVAPQLANMLRLWMPYAAFAQTMLQQAGDLLREKLLDDRVGALFELVQQRRERSVLRRSGGHHATTATPAWRFSLSVSTDAPNAPMVHQTCQRIGRVAHAL